MSVYVLRLRNADGDELHFGIHRTPEGARDGLAIARRGVYNVPPLAEWTQLDDEDVWHVKLDGHLVVGHIEGAELLP